jgi:hypothetical protein
MPRGFPPQDTGPGMNELFHDLTVEQEEAKAAKKAAKEWRDISIAPRDGTVIDVTNSVMDEKGWSVNAKFGKYSAWGKTYDEFVLVRDFDEFMPMRPGTLICPTKWRPAWR